MDHINNKFFFNSKHSTVKESLCGLCISNPNLLYYEEYNIILDKNQIDKDKVQLISGGGSGHEPAHSGFVLDGMLSAAVVGDIFSSPSYVNIIKAIELVYNKNGIILIVKNYTGDVINFRHAMEITKDRGMLVEMLIIDDDISMLEEININFNKRRGLCGTILVYKILGEMSKEKRSIKDIIDYGNNLKNELYTLGVSLSSCVIPYNNEIDYIGDNICEIGLGIHGEKGKEKIIYKNLSNLIDYMFKSIFEKNLGKEYFYSDNELCIVINNLGSITDMELYVILHTLKNYLDKYEQVKIKRIIFGKLITCFEMKGFSITLLSLKNNNFLFEKKEEILKYIDISNKLLYVISDSELSKNSYMIPKLDNVLVESDDTTSKIKLMIINLCNYLLDKIDYLNHLDKCVGDGDIGNGVEKAIKSILIIIKYLDFKNKIKSSFLKIGEIIASSFCGTSGALYASFFTKGSQYLSEDDNNLTNWLNFLINGTQMIKKVGQAELGDRTMLDILFPICKFIEEIGSNMSKLKKETPEFLKNNLEKIKFMNAKRGRSSYLLGKEVGFHDPGCVLIGLWFEYIINNI